MSATLPLEAPRWSWRRWCGTILAVALAQTGFIFWLAERARSSAAPPSFATSILLTVDPWSEKQLNELPALTDPTVFALPGHRGFSRRAWLSFTRPEVQLADWSEPPRWLELNPASLGDTFASYVATNQPPPLRIADKPPPRLALEGFSAPNTPTRTNSVLRIQGDLARRPLLSPVALPSWPHTDLLHNTEVDLLVNADGLIVVTSVPAEAESGLRAADQHALALARGARFAPIRGPRGERPANAEALLTRGRMIFQWHTVPVPVTNAPPVAP